MKKKKNIHPNSTRAYHEIADQLPKMQRFIYKALLSAYYPQTDRRVKAICRADDMNNVRPRITELIRKGLVEEVGTEICPVTGKRVRLVTTPYSAMYEKYKKGLK